MWSPVLLRVRATVNKFFPTNFLKWMQVYYHGGYERRTLPRL